MKIEAIILRKTTQGGVIALAGLFGRTKGLLDKDTTHYSHNRKSL